MKNKDKLSISVGIPAYNEVGTIKNLVLDLLRQVTKLSYLSEIIIASDGSTDATVKKVKSVKNAKVTLIDGKNRKGKAKRQNEIIKKCFGVILVFIDADTEIVDKFFLEKLTLPLITGESDVTSALLDELPPRTFLEKSLDVSMKIKRVLFKNFKKGNNVYNCHGPARAFSKEVYKKLNFKKSEGEDMYSYFATIDQNKRFTFVPEAIIRYRLPSIYKDHTRQSLRFLKAKQKYIDELGLRAREEFNIPILVYFRAALKCLPIVLRYPIHTSVYLVIYSLAKIESFFRKDLGNTWQILSSKTSN